MNVFDTHEKIIADYASYKRFTASQIVNETLTRSLKYSGHLPDRETLSQAIAAGIDTAAAEMELRSNAAAVWLENRIAVEETEGHLIRRKPLQIGAVVAALSEASGQSEPICKQARPDWCPQGWGSEKLREARHFPTWK